MTVFHDLWLYGLLVTGIVLVPGMDMIFVLAHALAGGRRNGLAATFGIMAGGACHALFGVAAVAGLSRLIPVLSGPMLMVGAGYMIWIGLTLARSSIVVGSVAGVAARRPGVVLAQGFVTCLLNPKAWMFVLAVFPQFLRPAQGPIWPQALAMAAITVAAQFAIYGGLALMAARGRAALVSNPGLTIWTSRVAGMGLVGAAVWTLWLGLGV